MRFTTGTYTGDGAATLVITGVGFQPKIVFVYRHEIVKPDWCVKNDQDGVNSNFSDGAGTQWWYGADMIISLDADGFTVGDGTVFATNVFNVAGKVYTYICWG